MLLCRSLRRAHLCCFWASLWGCPSPCSLNPNAPIPGKEATEQPQDLGLATSDLLPAAHPDLLRGGSMDERKWMGPASRWHCPVGQMSPFWMTHSPIRLNEIGRMEQVPTWRLASFPSWQLFELFAVIWHIFTFSELYAKPGALLLFFFF